MHIIQESILRLAQTHDITKLSLRQIGRIVGAKHAQQVKFHLSKLQQDGLIKLDDENIFRKVGRNNELSSLLDFIEIPILGEANCGPATVLNPGHSIGSLKLPRKDFKKVSGLFALVARGNSLNRASIRNKSINDGDLVIVDSENRSPISRKDYVVSIIDGAANIKLFSHYPDLHEIVLMSESSEFIEPIYVPYTEEPYYIISGVVVDVVKLAT